MFTIIGNEPFYDATRRLNLGRGVFVRPVRQTSPKARRDAYSTEVDLSDLKQALENVLQRHFASVDDEVEKTDEVAENETPGYDYEWTCRTEHDDEDDDDEDGGVEDEIDEDTITPARQDTITPARHPKSLLEDGDGLNRIFGLQSNKSEPAPKNPFVFIANRLTFLAQTIQPIIFDTSLIETGENFITVGINEDKTFPKIKSFDDLGRIACQINCNQTIRDEIAEFLKGSEYSNIFCFPEFLSKNGPGTDVWALKFICYKDK